MQLGTEIPCKGLSSFIVTARKHSLGDVEILINTISLAKAHIIGFCAGAKSPLLPDQLCHIFSWIFSARLSSLQASF